MRRRDATCIEPVTVHFTELDLTNGVTIAKTGVDGLYLAINLFTEKNKAKLT